jgi:hypothetical protein
MNLRVINTVLLIVVFLAFTAAAQEIWLASYNGPGNASDLGHGIAVGASANVTSTYVYVTGWSTGSGTGYDYATIKYDALGTQQWVARYNGPGNADDYGDFVAVDSSGNVYVAGQSAGSGTGDDYATIKYNTSGVQQWVTRYNGTANGNDYPNGVTIDVSGNVYVTGQSLGVGTGYDYATVKYNTSGTQQWVARYNGPGNALDLGNAIAVDGSGNVYVTGWSTGSGTDVDYATIKYNAAGQQQWVARYNGPGNAYDSASAIAVDGSGNVYVTGVSRGSGTVWDYATIKYNTSGVQQWVARYNGPANLNDVAQALAIDASGNVYVTGKSEDSNGDDDYATIKYNASGIQQWASRYKGPGNSNDAATGIAVDTSGGVFVTGYSTGLGTGFDFATIKYNASGAQQWVDRYNGPANGNDSGNAIVLDRSGNVYATGHLTSSGNGTDYATIKYYSCWPPCTQAGKNSAQLSRRGGISNRRHSARPASRSTQTLQTNGKSTVKNLKKTLVSN